MGDRSGPCKTTAYAGDHGLHVGKFATDILYNDGFHAVSVSFGAETSGY